MARQLKPLVEDIGFQAGQMNQANQKKQLTMKLGEFADKVKRFTEIGKSLYGGGNFQQMAEELATIAENAEAYVMKETNGEWFDGVTIKRNMNELKKYCAEFMKVAKEAQVMNQRMTGLYEDSGRVLSRYFEIQEAMNAEGIEGMGDVVEPESEEEKQVGALKHPSMKMEEKPIDLSAARVNEIKKLQERLNNRVRVMSRFTNEERAVAQRLNEADRKRIAKLKEDVTDEYPNKDWTKLDVPKLGYEQGLAFEKFLKKQGLKILRKDWKDRNTGSEFCEFFAPIEDFNEANNVAVKNYKNFEFEGQEHGEKVKIINF